MWRFFASTAAALIISAHVQGGTLTLTVDRQTGEAWIENLSSTPVVFDAYGVVSQGGNLDSDEWRSFEEFIQDDPVAAAQALGHLGWAVLTGGPGSIYEGNISQGGEVTAEPGFRISIGSPISTFVAGDLRWEYDEYDTVNNQGTIIDGLLNFIGDVPHPWQNPDNIYDVNASGSVTPTDALAIVNVLNTTGPGNLPIPVPTIGGPPPFLDVDGNDAVSVIDVLNVVNELNRIAAGGAAAVPEPATCLLIVLGIAFALATRRFLPQGGRSSF